MSITRSNSMSTFSTTGSSDFIDARSRMTDAHSTFTDAKSDSEEPHIAEKGEDQGDTTNTTEEQMTVKTEIVQNDETEKTDEDIKTQQPPTVKEPKAYISKDEKIRQYQEKKQQEKAGYQRKESQCHEYIFSNNMLAVLDLPSIKSLLSGCCLVCCNSGLSSGTTTTAKAV